MIRMDLPWGTGRAVRWGCVLGARPRLAARGQVSRPDDVESPLNRKRCVGQGGRLMPRCSVRLMRVTMPFVLSVLLLLGLAPGARGVQAQIGAAGMVRATLSPAISLSASSGGAGTIASLSGHGFLASDSLRVSFYGTRVSS